MHAGMARYAQLHDIERPRIVGMMSLNGSARTAFLTRPHRKAPLHGIMRRSSALSARFTALHVTNMVAGATLLTH